MPKEDWDNLAAALRAARGKRTLREVSATCGVSQGKIISLEKGRRPKTGLTPAVFRLAACYRWTRESVHDVLAGGSPTLEPAPPERHWFIYVDRNGVVGTCSREIPPLAYRVWPAVNPQRILAEITEVLEIEQLEVFDAAVLVAAWTRSFGWAGPAEPRRGPG